MIEEEKIDDQSKEEPTLVDDNDDKEKYYNRITLLQGTITTIEMLVIILPVILAIFFFKIKITGLTAFLLYFSILIASFIGGWILSFPFRILLYRHAIKYKMIKQEFKPWITDWLKYLIINMVVFIPSISLLLVFIEEPFSIIEPYKWLISFILILVIALPLRILHVILTIWLIHGIKKISDNDKYQEWKQLIQSQKIKEYPIYVLPLANKANWANALAFGLKGFGVILTSDIMLDKLTTKQFCAIMAHETAHLEHNDIPKRFLFILPILILLGLIPLISFDYLFELDSSILSIPPLIAVAVIFLNPLLIKKQELKADEYTVNVLNDCNPMIEALEFLYEYNKVPKEKPEKSYNHYLKLHPTFEDRKTNMQKAFEKLQ